MKFRGILSSPIATLVLKNIGARIPVLAFTTVATILSSRIVITSGGTEMFAYFATTSSILVLLSFADLGVGAAITNASAIRDTELENFERTLTSSTRVTLSSAIIICLLSVGALASGQWRELLGVDGPGVASERLFVGTTLSVVAFGLSLPLGQAQRILLGSGKNHLTIIAQGIIPFASLGIVAGVYVSGIDYGWYTAAPGVSILVGQLAVALVCGITTKIWIFKYLKSFVSLKSHPGIAIRATALPMLFVSIALPVTLHSDRLLLAHLSSTAELAAYSVAAQIYTPVWTIVGHAGMSLWPLFARDRTSSSRSIYEQAEPLFLGLGLLAALSYVLVAPYLVHLLSAGIIDADLPLRVAFGLLLLLQSINLPIMMIKTDVAGLRFQAASLGAMLCVKLTLAFVATAAIGAPAPILASCIGLAICQYVPGRLSIRHSNPVKAKVDMAT